MWVAMYQDHAQLCAYKTNNGHTGIGISAYLGSNPENFSGLFGRVIVNAGRWLISGPCQTPTPTPTASTHFNSNANYHANADSNGYAPHRTATATRNADRDGDSNSYTYFDTETFTDAETGANA